MDAKRLPGAYRIGEQSDKPLAALVYDFSKGDTEKRFARGGDRQILLKNSILMEGCFSAEK
jgi:hypothetical protein